MAHLKGKFVIHDEGETYRTGEIVAEVNDNYVLIRQHFMKEPDGPAHMMNLVSLEEIANSWVENGERPEWQIFESKQKLDEYLKWFEPPAGSEENIVPLNKAH